MARSRRFYNRAADEILSHFEGFRDAGQPCPDCGKNIGLKYRGDETNPESYCLNRCDKCIVAAGEGYSLQYKYETFWDSISQTAFYMAGPVYIAKLLIPFPAITGWIIYLAGLLPVALLARYFGRKKSTPQHQADEYLKGLNSEDLRIRKYIMGERAAAAAKERMRLRTISGIEEIDVMDGVMFEGRLQSLFTALGYKVQRTPASGDQGLDLILEKGGRKFGVQAKRYKKGASVGNAAVQEVMAGKVYYRCQEAWVVTNTRFTDSAWSLAKKAGVRLIDRNRLIELLGRAADADSISKEAGVDGE